MPCLCIYTLHSISIHAPLTGSDKRSHAENSRIIYFNPRSPYGERPAATRLASVPIYFNPRSPYGERLFYQIISRSSQPFQSTLPLRGATLDTTVQYLMGFISIHAPLTGSDMEKLREYEARKISIHAPLTGSDDDGWRDLANGGDFNPRSPYGERPAALTRS